MSLRNASVGFLEILAASVLMAGCGSFELEEPQALRSAQQQLAEAKRDPAVRRHGAIFLRDAEQTLDRARFARVDPAQARHLAYLAKRKVEIARSITGLQVASENLQALAKKSVAADALALRRADRVKAADAPKRRTGAASAKTRKAALPVMATTAVAGTVDRPKPPPKSPVASAVASNAEADSDQSAGGSGIGEDPASQELVISGIFSDFERAKLAPDVQRSLTPLVRYLRDNRDSRIIVEGYAGGPGGHEHSLSQSLGIAEAVKSYLTGEGIDGGRIFTLGRGASGPADDGGGAQPGMVNSRIEIGLFQGIGDPTPALSSRAAPSAAPVPPPP